MSWDEPLPPPNTSVYHIIINGFPQDKPDEPMFTYHFEFSIDTNKLPPDTATEIAERALDRAQRTLGSSARLQHISLDEHGRVSVTAEIPIHDVL
jgi:hypothetical protein